MNRFTEKIGPLPVWLWGVIIVGVGVIGYMIYSRNAPAKPVAPTPTIADGVTDVTADGIPSDRRLEDYLAWKSIEADILAANKPATTEPAVTAPDPVAAGPVFATKTEASLYNRLFFIPQRDIYGVSHIRRPGDPEGTYLGQGQVSPGKTEAPITGSSTTQPVLPGTTVKTNGVPLSPKLGQI